MKYRSYEQEQEWKRVRATERAVDIAAAQERFPVGSQVLVRPYYGPRYVATITEINRQYFTIDDGKKFNLTRYGSAGLRGGDIWLNTYAEPYTPEVAEREAEHLAREREQPGNDSCIARSRTGCASCSMAMTRSTCPWTHWRRLLTCWANRRNQ